MPSGRSFPSQLSDPFRPRGQFWIAQQRGAAADQGIEADNNGEVNDLTPRSDPTLYNLTLIGDPETDQGDESDIGILLRAGTSAEIANSIVIGFKETGLDSTTPPPTGSPRMGLW